VQEQPLTVARHRHRQHERLPFANGADGRDQRVVEQGMQFSPVGALPLRKAADASASSDGKRLHGLHCATDDGTRSRPLPRDRSSPVHSEIDLPLAIDRRNGGDLRQQLVAELRGAVLDRRLVPGQRLPSSRALAAQLRLARATVTAAFAELEGEGWVEARQGAGTWVSSSLDGLVPEQHARRGRPGRPSASAPLVDLVPGRPDTSSLQDAAWRRAWREAVSAPTAHDPPLAGLAALRRALADHVRRTRGVLCDADDVVVTAGTALCEISD